MDIYVDLAKENKDSSITSISISAYVRVQVSV